MNQPPIIDVIIPAYNEEKSIPKVIAEIPDFVRHVVVANNNSTDGTEKAAKAAGVARMFTVELVNDVISY